MRLGKKLRCHSFWKVGSPFSLFTSPIKVFFTEFRWKSPVHLFYDALRLLVSFRVYVFIPRVSGVARKRDGIKTLKTNDYNW